MDHQSTAVHGPGLLHGLTGLAKNAVGLVVSRLELAAVELVEVRNHVLSLLMVGALAVICAWFAIAYGTLTIVALAWDEMGWKILLIMFAVFVAIAAALVLKAKAMLKENKLTFPATMNELKHDKDMLL
jgi:uncharacterized membrane protein YqjE